MSERRAIQPIAPAGESTRGLKLEEDLKPLRMPEPKPKPKVERLSMSKQWVLPPRPKPGRKPKAASEKTGKAAKPVSATHRARDASERRGVKPEAKEDTDNDSCGLCSRDDGCVCEEIGLRASSSAAASPAMYSPAVHSPAASSPVTEQRRKSSISLPSLDMILNQSTIKMDAVPIKRSANGGTSNGGTSNGGTSNGGSVAAPMSKFKRAFAFEPMQPSPVMSVPSPLESMHMSVEAGCGFCSENTVCVCADTAGSQAPSLSYAAPPPAVNSLLPASAASAVQLPPPRAVEADTVQLDDDVYGCSECERGPMSMLFCVSLSAAKQLAPGAVAIPCNLAFKTLQKHHKFDGCDLGKLVRRLECNKKMVGVQSINRVLQDMERNEFAPQS